MKTQDLFEETYSAVTVNKVRSGLTMLGIVIGIASVIALVCRGAGHAGFDPVQHPIPRRKPLILITPGTPRGVRLHRERGPRQRTDVHSG